MITYRTDLAGLGGSDLDDFFEGWPRRPSPDRSLSILSSSYRTVLAFDGERLVGIITAISDGVLNAHITLLEVLPSHRRRGIGSELVTRMLAELANLYAVDAVCDANLVSFYDRFGLTALVGMARRVPANI